MFCDCRAAGFDGYVSDPLGGQLCLSLEDYTAATRMVNTHIHPPFPLCTPENELNLCVATLFLQLMASMDRLRAREPDQSVVAGKVISLLEGGYDTSPYTLGLAKCVDAHVIALQEG